MKTDMKHLLLLLFVLASSLAHSSEAASPQEAVNAFYALEIHGPFSDDGRMLGNARHLVSKELDALLTATDRYQDACRALVPPDVKPWIIDADPWYFHSADGARAIEGTRLVSQGRTAALVAAKLAYDPSMRWTDTVVLVKEADAWRIANIRFEQGGGLIESLRSYISQSCTSG